MWTSFNENNFPNVYVKMVGKPKDMEEFNWFTEKWDSFNYNFNNAKYTFIFDTREVGYVNVKYAFKMIDFIKKLKTGESQNLIGSIIIVRNSYVKFLLNLIFFFQKPVADVYLTSSADPEIHSKILTDIHNDDTKNSYPSITIIRK